MAGRSSRATTSARITRFSRVFEELSARCAVAEPVVYAEEAEDDVRQRLLHMDGVLVWVDPIVLGRERLSLDAMLRDVASRGVFVSAHPDVIQRMGTKEVLHRTREHPWGTDANVYRSVEELWERFLPLLNRGARVLKQHRGSSGDGVWKVERVGGSDDPATVVVRVQPALRGAAVEEMRFADLVEQRARYFSAFDGAGCFVDQPYAERLADGMVRCYLVQDRVAGFGHQFVTALLPPLPGDDAPPEPPPRLYYGPDKPEFKNLRSLLESGWIAGMQRLLDLDRDALPIIWDADFLLGARSASGEDTYVLCEINVSSVFPIPDESVAPLAEAAIERTLAAKSRRSQPGR